MPYPHLQIVKTILSRSNIGCVWWFQSEDVSPHPSIRAQTSTCNAPLLPRDFIILPLELLDATSRPPAAAIVELPLGVGRRMLVVSQRAVATQWARVAPRSRRVC